MSLIGVAIPLFFRLSSAAYHCHEKHFSWSLPANIQRQHFASQPQPQPQLRGLQDQHCCTLSFSDAESGMKAAKILGDLGSSKALDIRPSGGVGIGVDSLDVPREESSLSIPPHTLGAKPLGNKYTATSDAKDSIGYFQIFPDEVLALFLEYLEAPQLLVLGSTCKFMYAFCRSDDIWKALFIE